MKLGFGGYLPGRFDDLYMVAVGPSSCEVAVDPDVYWHPSPVPLPSNPANHLCQRTTANSRQRKEKAGRQQKGNIHKLAIKQCTDKSLRIRNTWGGQLLQASAGNMLGTPWNILGKLGGQQSACC